MRTRLVVAALSLLAVGWAVTAAAGPATTGALAGPANRIVGLWQTVGTVSPCGGGPPTITVRNTLLFHAGGTIFENLPVSPASLTARGYGVGTWSYDPATGWHRLHLRFDQFSNGAYSGYSTIDRMLLLSPDGNELTGEVVSRRYTPDGVLISELCGDAVSTRLN